MRITLPGAVLLVGGLTFAVWIGGGWRRATKLGAERSFLVDKANRNLALARAHIAKREDPTFTCGNVLLAARELARDRSDTAEDIRRESARVCGFEAPLAWGQGLVQRMSAAADASPGRAQPGSARDCIDLGRAIDAIEPNRRSDPAAAALLGEFQARCP